MRQEGFEARYADRWQAFEALLDAKALDAEQTAAFPKRYREICAHLALARDRRFSLHLVERLNDLVLRGHNLFYQAPPAPWHRVWHFFAAAFPRLIRAEIRMVLLSTLLFFGPLFGMGIAIQIHPPLVYSVMSGEQVRNFESMYEPDTRRVGRPRDANDDAFMFGFYIRNNIGVAFRTFAGGILLGLGSLFFIVYNGLAIGTVAGHLHHVGYGSTFFPFVVGHGSFELTAIVFAGAAGMRMGFALIDPRGKSRSRALRDAAKRAIQIVYGAAAMLVIAAFVEAFWSPSAVISDSVKYVVGAALWVLVFAYFAIAGSADGD